jgi:hypothetical protein
MSSNWRFSQLPEERAAEIYPVISYMYPTDCEPPVNERGEVENFVNHEIL